MATRRALDPFALGMGMGMGMERTVGGGMGGMNDWRGMRPLGSSDYSMYAPYGVDLIDRHQWRQTVYLVEFLMTSDWQAQITLPPPPADNSPQTATEIRDLLDLMGSDTQAEQYDNIMGEDVDFVGCFERLAFFDAQSHPNTSNLVQTMVVIGWTLAQYYKEYFGRIRPSALDARLQPIMRVPTHPAYPSGHATQCHLIMHALQEVVPDPSNKIGTGLTDLASRISVNREIAGVHYHSDTTCGQTLAEKAWLLIERNKSFQKLIDEAKAEWQRPAQSGRKFIDRS